jgi:aspartyl-tRNA(Asn)/glutamyl-tRNA(Gln) amidotransferase subunit A
LDDSCRAAIERAFARIAADAHLNAWSYLAVDEAMQAAHESDRLIAAGKPRSPFEGCAIAIKGNIAVRGWPHEGGLPGRRGLRAAADAPVVELLRAAGAIPIGLTTMDAAAAGAAGLCDKGPIRNPRRTSHSAGGSSGGSAAAVAAGHVEYALGTDTIGSVRIPAAFCGIAALKPSTGRVDTRGVLPLHPEFDHVGPMVATTASLEPLLALLAGEPPGAPPGDRARAPAGDAGLRECRIGYMVDAEDVGATAPVLARYAEGMERLRRLGARLLPLRLADLQPGRARLALFALCERALWSQHGDSLLREPEKYPLALASLLRYGGSLDEPRLAEYGARVARFADAVRGLMQPVHALVLPTTPAQAFDLDSPAPNDIADLTVIATAAGLPAASVPLPAADDLPAGLQIVGPRGEDHFVCRLATAI